MQLVKGKVELARAWLAEFDKIHSLNKNIITLAEHYTNVSQEEDNT
jgi:hypothetical protein